MAVSGRKHLDLSESVVNSSAEDFDHKCDPCLTDQQTVAAAGYCVTCREFLCKGCFKFHQKTSALKHHELLDDVNKLTAGKSVSTDATKSVPDIFTERCSTHKSEFIKYFCPKHETLGCTVCMTLNHRTCGIDYIPDKCNSIEVDKEYTEIMRNLDQRLIKTDHVIKKAEDRNRYIDTQCESVCNEVAKQRKLIDDKLDKLQENINGVIESRRSQDKKVLKEAISVCKNTSRDVKKMQTALQDNKASKKNIPLYIDIKRAKSDLKTNDIQMAELSIDKTNVKYMFKSVDDLEQQLSKLGEVSFPLNVSKKEIYTRCLTYVDKINVKTESDKAFFKCNVTGCVALRSNTVVLIDSGHNQKIKVVDTDKKTVVKEKVMDPPPSGICALPNDQFAATFPKSKKVLIMTVYEDISVARTIRIGEECNSVTYCKDRLVVLCNNPNCIYILDLQGKVLDKLSLKNKLSGKTDCIVYSEKANMLYINECVQKDINRNIHKVIALNLDGDISAECIVANTSSGMVVLDDGSLLICGNSSPNFYRISDDLKVCYAVDIDIEDTYSICYNRKSMKIYNGSFGSDMLKICDVK